jgi:hypothetical protein
MKKWLDKYIPKAQNGIEGTMGGLTDKGFNYNGAWGGTMQDGGYVDSVLNANKNLDWVKRLYEKNTPSIQIPGQKGRSTHFMESADGRVYPTVVRLPGGKMKYLGKDAYDYADKTKTYIQFPSDKEAQWFGENYKKGKGVLGNFAVGGSLPGTVGFTYARTAGAAPSNGPYAKKTKASAQFGDSVKKYQKPTLKEISKIPGRKVKEDSNLENIFEIVDPTGISSWDDIKRSYDETGWSPQTALEVFGAIPLLGKVGKVGKIAKEAGKVFAITARQARNARVAGETLSAIGKYGPAAGRATDTYQAYDEFQNGGEMKYYQEGLDFKPKTISQDGTVIDPEGYWNPENWGKAVVIPSNIITMEGVDQPLIGISDTGDVQYMEPGENYEFDGEYVTEMPVAKGGVSVNNVDAQPLKKLDQLLNFTNYNKPTTGGWLDKY